MAQILDLGKIRFNWAGTYDAGTQYEYNDLVKYGPNLYAFTAAAAATGIAPTNTGSWTLVVEGFNFRGTYATETLYYVNDVVTDGVSAFIATAQHTSADADINDNENFALLALGQSDLPSQLSAINKVLTTNGTDPFWTATTYLTKQYLGSGQGQTAAVYETAAGLTNAASVIAVTANDFAQFAFTNTSNAADASTDFIAYTDTGNNDSGFVDLGITSSTFSDPDFTITGPNDAYLFASAPRGVTKAILIRRTTAGVTTLTTGSVHGYEVGDIVRVEGVTPEIDGQHTITAVPSTTTFSFATAGLAPTVDIDVIPEGSVYRPVGHGNLVFATDESGLTNAIVFAAGGYYSNNTQMAIFPDQMVHIEIPTESNNPSTGALVVAGGAGITGNINVDGYVMTNQQIYLGNGAKPFETAAALTDVMTIAQKSSNSFAQFSIVNTGNGAESSSDFIAYSVAGNNDSGWIDMGITNPAFDSETYGVTGPGDGYIFVSSPEGNTVSVLQKSITSNVATLSTNSPHSAITGQYVSVSGVGAPFDGEFRITGTPTPTTFTYSVINPNISTTAATGTAAIRGGNGNLVLATNGTGLENKIVLAAGGLASGNEQMVITPDQSVHIEIATESFSPSTGALTVVGGIGSTGNVNIEGMLYSGNAARTWAITTAELTNPVSVFRYDSGVEDSTYAQIAFQNTDPTSSTDFIVYMDNGNDDAGFYGFGIAGSEFDDTAYGITGPGDFYMFGDTVDSSYKGNMVFATGSSGSENRIVFAAGGYASGNSQMIIIPDTMVHIEIPTESTSPTTGALVVAGGVGISGNVNVAGNVNIAGTIQFGGGGTTVETENLAVTDPMIFVGTDNLTDVLDLAFVGERAGATTLDPTAAIVKKSLTSNVATLQITYGPSSEPFKVGDSVVIAGVDPTFNGTFTITNVQTSPTRISYAKTAANVAEANATTNTSRVVTNKALSSNVATLTTSAPHTFAVGESVTVTGVDATFNGAYIITATPSATSFSYSKTGADVPSAPATTSYTANITQKALASNVATLTTSAAHGFSVGETVVVAGVDATFNGTFTISAVTTTTFSYGLVGADAPQVAATGTATVDRIEGAAVAAQYLGTANSTDVFRPRFTGLARDASDGGTYKLFDGLKTKPATTVDFTDVDLSYAPLRVGNLTADLVTVPQVTISGTPTADTDAATLGAVKAAAASWVVKTSAYTAVNGDMLWLNTSGGAFTVTLPASPAVNTRIRLGDVASSWNTNKPIIARNGNLIMGLAEDLTLDLKNAVVELIYSGSTYGWRVF